MLPDGDLTGGAMAEVTEKMAKLNPEDQSAIALYIKTAPAIPNNLTKT